MSTILILLGVLPAPYRMVLDHKYLTPNYALRSAIEDWKQENEERHHEGDEGDDEDGEIQGKNMSRLAYTSHFTRVLIPQYHSTCSMYTNTTTPTQPF